jgi:uncharacterized RDD family membrane protein YckC
MKKKRTDTNEPEYVVLSGVLMDEIVLSSWADRLWAWLIDVLLLGILWYKILIVLGISAFGLTGYLLLSALLFIYWTLLEGYRGQSLGKMLLNIVVTGPLGENITFRDAAVESFGKSFLLPFDCIVSWFAFKESRQRLFNKISNTIVINRME